MIDKNQVVAVRSKSAGGRIIDTDVNREPHLYESLYPEGYVSTLLGQLEDERAAREQWQKNCRRVEQLAEAAEERAEALAVENVAMRSVIDAAIGVANNSSGIAGWHLNGEIADWDEILPELNIETPATDAALAAIEARSITAALDSCSEYLDTDCVMDRLGISYADAELRSIGAMEICNALKSHAANIREAK
ncbi:hypothetical protein BMF90_02920 [Serratia sp. OLHL2]|uniref:eae-like domain protein n=1 Tax=unclassified Serratia (in: enterobacteria) TaxID=2647522 RepID=UPI000C1A5D08|nr:MULTISPECIES: eae-like domain protein [unclassified Serratia (in: enterobacteria)]PII51930.1 hypothetical protein BMF92_22785 [Serratia sp. OLBL1]PII56803.1 hypothetical protein BMF87_00065 [Serratia sp. OLEL1]PII60080.1 hypothetical protein BMF85_07520 [Serratia sp. OLCL1]PII67280.1 hypothetical protein BMF90_02920 [Serratia sp. OLHL2]PII69120.1 hypothetical protein BMF88_24635 [Serratia sp. OLDL1]